jgi:hypothetical protein
MAKISGKDGKVKYGASPTEIKITDWSYDKQIGLKDVSDSGSVGGKEFLPDALYEVDGSFSGFVLTGATLPTFGTEIALELIMDAANKWAGNGIITSQGEKLQVVGGDAVKVSFSFKGSGAWTRTAA